MLDTSTRLLRLLSLLQTRKEWPGTELAGELEITTRTLRRDIDRLRDLGYPINARIGVGGGYQLGAGAEMPPLLLDDEETLAVAVGLQSGAIEPVIGIGEPALRALAKLRQVMPSRLQHRLDALKIDVVEARRAGSAVEADLLSAISTACHRQERLRFDYRAQDGAQTRRDVEPYRVVRAESRWYLLAWDIGQEDWRTLGFGFSGPTREKGWGVQRVAGAWVELMRRLGYEQYGLQGGDFGSLVSPEVARLAPGNVLGVHLNALVNASTTTDPEEVEELSEDERQQLRAQEKTWRKHSGYATEMSTRPQTLAYALNDSPAGQLAWNLEWFVDWDPTRSEQIPVEPDAILTDTTILWLTGTAGSAARLYLEAAQAWGTRAQVSGVPTGVANFLGDGALRTLAAKSHRIVHWTRYPCGGHFASLQAPDVLVDDVRQFFRLVRN